jgi:transposase
LGLIDNTIFDYENFNNNIRNYKRGIKDKASCLWIEALNNMRLRLSSSQNRIITVADRESDFYEFMHSLVTNNEEFVIRSKFNRYTGAKHRSQGDKSWDIVDRSPIRGKIETSIQDAKIREFKTITLDIKAIEVILPPVYKSKDVKEERATFFPIKVNIVKAYNAEHEWFLLTNLPIESLNQIEEIVKIYKSRWHIEDYFKVLKTGYQVDEIYLHSSKQAIENLLIMASISACRLYWIIYVGRKKDCITADHLFESFEWKALYVFFGEKIPEKCPSLSEILLKIARMGGYKSSSKNAPPGVKTMWHGFQQFIIATQMYRNMSRET